MVGPGGRDPKSRKAPVGNCIPFSWVKIEWKLPGTPKVGEKQCIEGEKDKWPWMNAGCRK